MKVLRYITTLIIIVSLVHLTSSIVSFSKEIIILKDSQLKAKIKAERMLHPAVKITSIAIITSSESNKQEYATLSAATGFSVKYYPKTNESLLVTNAHFCEINMPGVSFIVEDHKKSSLELNSAYLSGTVVLSKPSLDLCLIKADGYIKPAKLASYHYNPMPFEEIYVVGGPSGTFPIIIDTYISSILDRSSVDLGKISSSGNDLILISEQVFPGHSGSPIFTKDGEIIGIIFGALRSYGGLAVSVKDIYKIMEEIEE